MLLNAMYLSLFCTMVGPQLLVAPELPLWASVVLVVLGVVPPIVTVRYLIPPAVHDLVIITGRELRIKQSATFLKAIQVRNTPSWPGSSAEDPRKIRGKNAMKKSGSPKAARPKPTEAVQNADVQ
jgi:hypothetical protein